MAERKLVIVENFPDRGLALLRPLDEDVREAKLLAQKKLSNRANLLERDGWKAEDTITWDINADNKGIIASLTLTRHH